MTPREPVLDEFGAEGAELHLASVPVTHTRDASCWCDPVRSSAIAGGVLWIHRASAEAPTPELQVVEPDKVPLP